jgi:pilus assembly protein Flp/PilA
MFFALRELIVRIEGKMEGKEKGQTLIEYALLVVLIAIVVIVALQLLGPQIATVFQDITDDLGGV